MTPRERSAVLAVLGGGTLSMLVGWFGLAGVAVSDAGDTPFIIVFFLIIIGGGVIAATIARARYEDDRIVRHAIAIYICGVLMAFFGCLGVALATPANPSFQGGFAVFGIVIIVTVTVLVRFLRRAAKQPSNGGTES